MCRKNRPLSTPLVLFALLYIVLTQCRPEEEIFDGAYTGGLVFSNDTIRFDTLFSTVGSTSKRIKVLNPSSNALNIERIYLGNGAQSSYTITVSGIRTREAEDQIIYGGDSLLVLVEVRIDPRDEDLPYLVKDSIVFVTNGVAQDIKLIAWGQDAIFKGNEVIECNTTWQPDRPVVLYAPVLVDSLCTLTVEPGCRIYSTHNTYLYVRGSLQVLGTASQRVLFRNDRLEPVYENAPGQWGGIVFLEGTGNNLLQYTVIRNAEYGIRLGKPDNDTIPDVVVRNTIIENMSHSGILCFTSDLYAVNTLVHNCKYYTAAGLGGGTYRFEHCTFSNSGFTFFRETPSFAISDNIPLDDGQVIVEDVHLSVINSIIHGNMQEEITFNADGGAAINALVAHSLLTTQYDGLSGNGNILNQDPAFINAFNYNYRLDTLSPAKDAGMPLGIYTDLDSMLRDSLPDIGAYERIE
jgi:hypothetical protein